MRYSWKIKERELPPGLECYVIQWGEISEEGEWSTHPVYMPWFLVGIEAEQEL